MIMMARNMDYSTLLDRLNGRKTLIWTCNTCARLSNGIGGTDAAERLSEKLKADGIPVVGMIYTSAACIRKKVIDKKDPDLISKCDVILSLTCDVGALDAKEVFGKEVLNPIETLGPGYIEPDGGLFLVTYEEGKQVIVPVPEIVASRDLYLSPFV